MLLPSAESVITGLLLSTTPTTKGEAIDGAPVYRRNCGWYHNNNIATPAALRKIECQKRGIYINAALRTEGNKKAANQILKKTHFPIIYQNDESRYCGSWRGGALLRTLFQSPR